MDLEFIISEKENSICTIYLNRTRTLNSFNLKMAEEFQSALKDAEKDDAIRVIVISGKGRAFSAGQDLKEVLPKNGEQKELSDIVAKQYNPIIKLIRNIEKPIICAVNGVAAGAGANIAFACDFVIAAYSSTFIQSFSQIGLIPDSAGTFTLPRLVGLAKATELCMLGNTISARDAKEFGLIYKAVPDADLEVATNALCNQLKDMPTRGLGLIKRAFNQSFANSLDEQLKLEEELQKEAGNTYDYNEGVNAFIQKRKPVFKGQ